MVVRHATAPTRIDLAGGTVDIWPVCFALDRPATTTNLAIDIRVEVIAEPTRDGHLEVVSVDRGERVRVPLAALAHDTLGLATRHVAHFGGGDGLKLELRSHAPPQSGLGGSSALGVALAGALGGPDVDLRVVQDIETALLGVPTGYQDYVPPLRGGVNTLTAAPGGARVERLDGAEEFLAGHLLLVDTCIAHQSGMNNWEVVKRFLDGDAAVRRSMNAISECAAAMRDALVARDLDAVARALDAEWQERRRLAPVVSNDAIEAIAAAARDAGALAAKVCGAGGGGCMVIVARDARDAGLARAVTGAGGRVLPFRPDPRGLSVT